MVLSHVANLALISGRLISVYTSTTSILLIAIKKSLPTAHINAKLWITILLSTAIFLFQFEPLFLWFLLRYTPVFLTTHRPIYIKVYSPMGATEEPLKLCSRRPSHKRSTISLTALREPGRTSRPSWIIILTPHTYSRIFPDFHPTSRPSSLNPSAY